MLYSKSNNASIYLKIATFIFFCFFIISAQAQNDAVLLIKGQTILKSRAKGLGLNAGVKGVDWKEEPQEGVNIEVKKNDATIIKITSGKKGKYSLEIPVSTTDLKNDYTVYFTKEGTAPRTVTINAYLSKEEFTKYTSAKYELELALPLIATTIKDIVPDKPFAKIKWDKVKEHKFSFDETYAKTALGEERKIEANPDLYYTSLAKKKKKEEETIAKNKAAADAKLKASDEAKRKADEDARLKAEADTKKLADLKAKEDAERIVRENLEAMKQAMAKKRMQDSLDKLAEAERKKALETANAKLEIKKNITPVEADKEESKTLYDVSDKYSINQARKSLSAEKERRNKEKGKNLTAKYESFNILTSLLNMVDEYDKKNKTQ